MKAHDILYLMNITALEDDLLFEKWYRIMDGKRQEKIDSIGPKPGKLLSLGAGILLRKALEDAGITDWEIELRGREKPYLKGREDFFFNISHSGQMVCLAASDKEVGVDLQKVTHFKDRLIDYVFNDSDKALAKELADKGSIHEEGIDAGILNGSGIDADDAAFTILWTMKESIMKYSGRGISMEPKKIELFSKEGKIKARAESFDCAGLNMFTISEGEYKITVCTGNQEMPEVVRLNP